MASFLTKTHHENLRIRNERNMKEKFEKLLIAIRITGFLGGSCRFRAQWNLFTDPTLKRQTDHDQE